MNHHAKRRCSNRRRYAFSKFGTVFLSDNAVTLAALRDGLGLLLETGQRPSILSRLKADLDVLVSRCKEVWDSVGEHEEFDEYQELSSYRSSGRYYGIRRTEWGSDNTGGSSVADTTTSREDVATQERSGYVGTTLAASISTSVSSVLPTVLIGTQSVFTTIVHAGSQVAIPHYALTEGQLVFDHYTILQATQSIPGWYPHAITTVSVSCIPLYAATFGLAHTLDSIHSYLNNRCTAQAAVSNVLSGLTAGGLVGSAYYGAIAALGIAHAPIISTGLCLTWLVGNYFRHRNSLTDLAVGGLANLAGLASFLMYGSPWLSVISALAGSFVASSTISWLSDLWSRRLRERLRESAAQILGVDPRASRVEIESAYRQLARMHHPDKQGDRTLFELICVSKEILLTAETEPESSFSFMELVTNISNSFLSINQQPKPKHVLELPTDFLVSPD